MLKFKLKSEEYYWFVCSSGLSMRNRFAFLNNNNNITKYNYVDFLEVMYLDDARGKNYPLLLIKEKETLEEIIKLTKKIDLNLNVSAAKIAIRDLHIDYYII